MKYLKLIFIDILKHYFNKRGMILIYMNQIKYSFLILLQHFLLASHTCPTATYPFLNKFECLQGIIKKPAVFKCCGGNNSYSYRYSYICLSPTLLILPLL